MYFKNINFILIILAVSGSFQAKVSAFQVLTQPNVTAVRGRSVTLPCTFPDGPPVGVYWDAHNYTDSSVKHARIVAQVVKGVVSTPGGSRYSITKEYSLVITNVTIHDETTFICTVVVPEAAGMNRTNVRVIALANPLHPVVNGCPISYSDSCTKSAPCCIYTVADIVPETFSLTCSVNLVRPAVSLTWTGGNGEERPTTDSQTLTTGPDANGLFNISAKLEVSKRENGQNFICKASGEGVDGKAHVTASVQYPPVEVSTEPSLTAVWGGTIRLPCRFEDHPTGVYWFRHSATGAPFVDSDENLLVHFFRSQANAEGDILVKGGPRFKMTSDYSLMISNVAVGDETTYSCQVAGAYSDGHNETDLRVIALSNPLHPTVNGCPLSSSGSCTNGAPCCVYTVVYIVQETFPLTCSVNLVRPAVNLTWKGGNGAEHPLADSTTVTMGPDANGLFSVSTRLEVSKPEIGQDFICKASGEGVNGTAHVTASVQYPPEKSGLSAGGVAVIIIFFLLLLIGTVIALLWYYGKVLFPIIGKRILNKDDPKAVKFSPKERKRSLSKDDPEADPLSPQERKRRLNSDEHEEDPLSPQQKVVDMVDEIKNYQPGNFFPLGSREGKQLPKRSRLALFGATNAGKLSLVRSFNYAVNGEILELKMATTFSSSEDRGTIATKSFRFTKYIAVVNNLMLTDLNVNHIPKVMAQIRKSRENNRRDRIECAALVFDARQPIQALRTFLPAFVAAVRKEYSTHPPVVFTHGEEVKDRQHVITQQAIEYGAHDQRVSFVENFTEKPKEPCIERRLEFLSLLKKWLHFADENLCHKIDQIEMGGGSNTV